MFDDFNVSKVLKLKFKTGEGSHKIMTISRAKDDLGKEEIKEAMQKIADSKVFVKEGVELYAEPVSAYTVNSTSATIFKAETVSAD